MESKKPLICLIDDDELFHLMIKKTIANSGIICDIIDFFDGEQAINFFISHSSQIEALPTLILLDLNMPFMDGWQFLDAFILLRLNNYNPYIYIVTSSSSRTDIQKAESYEQVSGYRIKPITKDQFLTIVEKIEQASH